MKPDFTPWKIMGNFPNVMRPSGIISAHFLPCLCQCSHSLLLTTFSFVPQESSVATAEAGNRFEMLGNFTVAVAKGSVLGGLEKPSHSAEKAAADFIRKICGILRQNFALPMQNESTIAPSSQFPG